MNDLPDRYEIQGEKAARKDTLAIYLILIIIGFGTMGAAGLLLFTDVATHQTVDLIIGSTVALTTAFIATMGCLVYFLKVYHGR